MRPEGTRAYFLGAPVRVLLGGSRVRMEGGHGGKSRINPIVIPARIFVSNYRGLRIARR